MYVDRSVHRPLIDLVFPSQGWDTYATSKVSIKPAGIPLSFFLFFLLAKDDLLLPCRILELRGAHPLLLLDLYLLPSATPRTSSLKILGSYSLHFGSVLLSFPPDRFSSLSLQHQLCYQSKNVVYQGLHISSVSSNASHPTANSDAIDIYRSSQVSIRNWVVDNDDDCVSFKVGRIIGKSGLPPAECSQNTTIAQLDRHFCARPVLPWLARHISWFSRTI